jgi:ATP-dependent Clp protease ATP-binding subunit ClpX
MFDLPGLDGVEEVTVNREVAESRSNPLFTYGKERAEGA